MWRGLLLAFVLLPGVARADKPFCGGSAFAAMHPAFPCDQYLAWVNRSPRPAMSVLWGTFGEDPTCVERFLNSNAHRPHLLQIHFSNETCRRKGNCRAGELFGSVGVRDWNQALESYNFLAYLAIQQRVIEIFVFTELRRNANTVLMLSTGLEDNYSFLAYQRLSGYLHAPGHWPHIVNRSPLGNRGYVYGDFYERHGGGARCRVNDVNVVNEDGDEQRVRDSRKFLERNQGCFAAFLWRKKHQGRDKASGRERTAPRNRTFEIPDRDVRELGQLLAEECL